MRPISDMLPLVIPHVAGCPNPIAANAIRAAAAEWCERTRTWRVERTVAVTEQAPAIGVPAYAAIHQIEEASFDGQPLDRVGYDQVLDLWPDPLAVADTRPTIITQVTPDTILILPRAQGELRVSLYVKPTLVPRLGPGITVDTTIISVDTTAIAIDSAGGTIEDFLVLPDFLFTQYPEQIAFGALARLFRIPKQPFTDAGLAVEYGTRFEMAMNQHFAAGLRGQQRAPRRTRPRFF